MASAPSPADAAPEPRTIAPRITSNSTTNAQKAIERKDGSMGSRDNGKRSTGERDRRRGGAERKADEKKKEGVKDTNNRQKVRPLDTLYMIHM
jgi:hypothetical protein